MVRSDTDQWDIVSSVGYTALLFTLVDENGWAPARAEQWLCAALVQPYSNEGHPVLRKPCSAN
jgi:hypothetical protein